MPTSWMMLLVHPNTTIIFILAMERITKTMPKDVRGPITSSPFCRMMNLSSAGFYEDTPLLLKLGPFFLLSNNLISFLSFFVFWPFSFWHNNSCNNRGISWLLRAFAFSLFLLFVCSLLHCWHSSNWCLLNSSSCSCVWSSSSILCTHHHHIQYLMDLDCDKTGHN